MTLHQHRYLFTTLLTGITIALSLTFTTIADADFEAFLEAHGTFVDSSTGVTFEMDLSVDENKDNGVGMVFLYLHGKAEPCNTVKCNAIRACSIRGSGTVNEEDHILSNVRCARPGNMSVSINDCKAQIETHGYVHSDPPYTAYSGSTTIDIKVIEKTGEGSLVDFTFYTPKKAIKVQGTLDGDISMSTCATE
jgi:hypothetical protein